MIFIVGHTFTIGKSAGLQPLRGGSVMQQINEARLQPRVDSSIPLNMGSTYRLVRIKPIIKDKKPLEFEYDFADMKTGELKRLTFPNTEDADSLIARLSGKVEEYKQLKEHAAKIQPLI